MALNRQADGRPFNRTHGTCRRCGRDGELRGRGLDAACHQAARLNGTLIDYERRNRPLVETVEDVRHLVAAGCGPEEIARRLDITPESLRVRLWEAEKRGLIDRRKELPVALYARAWKPRVVVS